MSHLFAIWDVDGTLVDSRRLIGEAMDAAFEDMGLAPPGYDRTREIVGLPLAEACKRLAPIDHRDDPAFVARIVESYRKVFVGIRSKPNSERLYPGARKTLERLANTGWTLAVATGKSRKGLEHIMETHGLAPLFHTLWCADDGPGKPHPFMVEEAIAATGASRARTVMIGDTSHDVAMARAAGVRAWGVSWGFHTAEELTQAGADALHHSFDELDTSLDAFADENAPSQAETP